MTDAAAAPTPPKRGGLWRNALWTLAILAAAAAAYETVQEARRSELIPNAQPAPDFALARYQGGTLTLGQLRGKVVMLDFWATWCGPCVSEMPGLYALAREYEARGLTFVAANNDGTGTEPRDVARFVQHAVPGLDPYVVYADAPTAARYRVQVLPTLYLIGRDGNVVDAVAGQEPEFMLRRRLEKALR